MTSTFDRDLGDAPTAACGPSLGLQFNVSDLVATWTALGGATRNARGLPDLLAVGTTVPVSSLASSASFFEDVALMKGAVDEAGVRAATAACDIQSVFLPFRGKPSGEVGGAQETYDLSLTFVANRGAAVTNRTLADFEAEVQATHAAKTGFNVGWDRWLDAHLGLEVPDTPLDAVGRKLDANARPYKAHLNDALGSAGSLWSSGARSSSVGVEFHGTFDFGFFAEANLTTLDYCAADSDGRAATSQTGRVGTR